MGTQKAEDPWLARVLEKLARPSRTLETATGLMGSWEQHLGRHRRLGPGDAGSRFVGVPRADASDDSGRGVSGAT